MNLFEDINKRLTNMDEFLSSRSCFPHYNVIKEDDGSTIIEFALAGFNKEDLKVEKDRYEIHLTAKSKQDAKKYLRKGISNKPFKVAIPRVDRELKEVTFLDGVLKIRLIDTEHLKKEVEITDVSEEKKLEAKP